MKLKRFLTGVLSAVMALSVCALPALADDETTVKDPTNPKLTASTIDKTQVGSITIHKYGRLDDPTAENGTGEVDTTVAENKDNKPLEGVEFTLYRVKTTAELLKYYDALAGASVGEFTVGDCFTGVSESSWSATTLEKAYTKEATGKGADATVGKVGTAKTNAKGAAQFNGLPVGMYLVIETNKVQSVTKTVTPFLVSIPMTRIGDTKSETTGDNNLKQWLYDVVVYPKNSTAQGTVTLVKQGKHGDATPEKLGGVMFKLFQYQGADGSGKYVDITDKLTNKTTDGYVVTDSDTNLGKITFSDLPMGKYYVQEYGYTGKGSDKGYIINTNGKYGFKIDDQGKVAVQAETGETDWVTEGDGFKANNDNGATITITNYKPEFEKTVKPRTGTISTDNHQADYGIGDKVPYTLTIKVPENVAKLHTFKVVDTTLKDQLLHIDNDFTLTATDKNNGTPTLENDAYTKEITVGKDAEKKDTSILTVNFTPAKLASVAGGTITIRYYATLGAGAVVAENGNLNTAKLLYSRKTDTVDGTGETDKPYEITDEGVVYTFMTSIEKKGKGGSYNEKPMPGVTFALYRKVEDAEWNNGDKVTIAGQEYTKKGAVPGATAVELGLAATENETWVLICHDAKGRELEATTDKNGIVEYKGLPSGTYKFIETKTLDKYNLLTSPVDAKLSLSYTTTWKDISAYDENGNLTNHKSGTVKYENGDPKAVIQIVNRSGFQLPVTGGFGTLLFSGIGVLLVLAGVAVLFSMKKKNDRT